jgi:hypothetical protein
MPRAVRTVLRIVRIAAAVGLGVAAPLAGQNPPPSPAGAAPAAPCLANVSLAAIETSGSYNDAEGTIAFQSVSPAAGSAYVTIAVNELQLSASINFSQLTASLDSRMTGLRRVPDITEADHDLLGKFARGLKPCITTKPSEAATALLRVTNLFAEWPEGLPVSRDVAVSDPQGIQMLCSKAKCTILQNGQYVLSYTGNCVLWNWLQYSNHDCNQCENNEPNCQQRAQLGDHYYCNGSEWYWTGTQWKCGEPNHWYRPYIVGNCIGRCGPGCSGWDKQYTKDCTNHDTCIRNGHWDWSWWCNDEFVLAIDDFLFAPDCY